MSGQKWPVRGKTEKAKKKTSRKPIELGQLLRKFGKAKNRILKKKMKKNIMGWENNFKSGN